MISIYNIRNAYGDLVTLRFKSVDQKDVEVDAGGEWLAIPSLIDVEPLANVNWENKVPQAINNGISSLFYISKPIDSLHTLQSEKEWVGQIIKKSQIPLQTHIYGEITQESVENLGKFKSELAAIIIPDKRDLNDTFLNRIFQIAAQEEVMVAFSAQPKSPGFTHKLLSFAEKYATQVLLLNISTLTDLTLLRDALKSEMSIDAAVPASALLSSDFLWEALVDQSIDYVTSGQGDPNLLLMALMDGYHKKKLAIEEIVALGKLNVEKNFRLQSNQDLMLIDLQSVKVTNNGGTVRGWPRYVVINDVAYPCTALS